jgi:hypothetical protein
MFVHEEMKTNSKSSNGSNFSLQMPRSDSTFSMSANSNVPVFQVLDFVFKPQTNYRFIFCNHCSFEFFSIGKLYHHTGSSDEANA